jgi:hypothetical protein
MNEEWFGVVRIGDLNDDGVYEADPRMAYDVLKAIWKTDPYDAGKPAVDQAINDVDMELYSLKSAVRTLNKAKEENEKFQLTGGSFKGEMLVNGFDGELKEDGENGLGFSDGQMLFLDFGFQPTKKISGEFSINMLANVADSAFEFRYGDRGLPITVEVKETTAVSPDNTGTVAIARSDTEITDNERIEIYDFEATYEDNDYDLLAFYHTPRFHWGYEGDFFGLVGETTDMAEQDIWNAKAPYGVEYIGKNNTYGLKILAGPEVYWGANPKALVKYEFGGGGKPDGLGQKYAVIFSEDIAQRNDSSSATEATERQTRQATVYGRNDFSNGSKLELGGMIASTEKIGDEYDRIEGDDIILVDEIEFEDTLAFKARYQFNAGATEPYVQYNYAGLVADAPATFEDRESELPWSGLGNKQVIEGGFRYISTPHMIYPRFMYRENLVDANPTIAPTTTGTTLSTGIDPRNRDDDPFAVLDNREATSLEFVYTYDPTPGTWFYDWDIDMKEDSPVAFNIGLIATSYDTDTDANLFFFEEGGGNASFGAGLEAEDVWLLKSKMIFNTSPGYSTILNVYTGTKQSTGQPGQETLEFFSIDGKFIVDRKHIYGAYIKVDDFGGYDFYEQFNLVYPLQLKLEYTRLLDQKMDEETSSRWGVKAFYRELDELSPAEEYQDGANDYMMEIQTYFEVRF